MTSSSNDNEPLESQVSSAADIEQACNCNDLDDANNGNKRVTFRNTITQQQQHQQTVNYNDHKNLVKTRSKISLQQVSPKEAIRRHDLNHFDLASGSFAARLQTCRELDADMQRQRGPRSKWQKRRGMWCWTNKNKEEKEDTSSTRAAAGDGTARYFRLRSSQTMRRRKPVWRFFLRPMDYNTAVAAFVRWSFRASFLEVVLMSFVVYMSLIFFFAGCIELVGYYQPQCFVANDGFEAGKHFVDAFHMSWTTISTVGYGIMSPRVEHNAGKENAACIGINAFMAFEAFVGVTFGGIVSAVMLGKIARVQSVARVLWSSPVCVLYGSGACDEVEEDDAEAGKMKEIPCPVLEFRLVNELSSVKGCEIIDANVSVVATTLASKTDFGAFEAFSTDLQTPMKGFNTLGAAAMLLGAASTQVATQVAKKVGAASTQAVMKVGTASTQAAHKVGTVSTNAAKTTGAALFGATLATTQAAGSFLQRINHQISGSPHPSMHPAISQEIIEEAETTEFQPYSQKDLEERVARELAEQLVVEQAKITASSTSQDTKASVFVPGEDPNLAPDRIFHKLNIETDAHPFMKRMWNIRHGLDATSPLLSDTARRMILDNDGFWPEQLNHYAAVRQHLHFHEIIVNFSGTANASGSTVISQKVYSFADVAVGYCFAQVMHVAKDGKLAVDTELLNDVKEQPGGGGEPLTMGETGNSPLTALTDAAAAVTSATLVAGRMAGDQALIAAKKGVDVGVDFGKAAGATIEDFVSSSAILNSKT